jgi:RNA polymerase sigma-70 factor, ECF subfamily
MSAARFRRLLEPVHDRALAFARCLCRSQSDGDDLFQEAALRAFSKLDDLRDDAAFRTWFYRIVITVHRNRTRTAFWRRLLPFVDSGAFATTEPGNQPNTQAELASLDRVRAALAILPVKQREAIVLFEIEGWKVHEIAVLQNVSTSAIKSQLVRGRDRLRRFYEKRIPAAVPVIAGGSP